MAIAFTPNELSALICACQFADKHPGKVRMPWQQAGKAAWDKLLREERRQSGFCGCCPHCGATCKERERRPNGNDTCENGHVYPSSTAVL